MDSEELSTSKNELLLWSVKILFQQLNLSHQLITTTLTSPPLIYTSSNSNSLNCRITSEEFYLLKTDRTYAGAVIFGGKFSRNLLCCE